MLARFVSRGLFPQSYLFVGPGGVGKKLVAREFANLLTGGNSLEPLHNPDILMLEPQSEERSGQVKKKKIAVSDIREALLFLSRYPTLGKYRVVIIDEAEELSLGGQNALLKVLEEPNSTSIIILVTELPGKLLPTLLSRLALVSFDLVPEETLRFAYREQKELPPDFFFSLGIPGLIENALYNPEGFQTHQEQLRRLFRISKSSLRERMLLADELSNNQEELPTLLRQWLAGLHQQFLQGEPARVQKSLVLLERLFLDGRDVIARRGNTRLILEKLFLSL